MASSACRYIPQRPGVWCWCSDKFANMDAMLSAWVDCLVGQEGGRPKGCGFWLEKYSRAQVVARVASSGLIRRLGVGTAGV